MGASAENRSGGGGLATHNRRNTVSSSESSLVPASALSPLRRLFLIPKARGHRVVYVPILQRDLRGRCGALGRSLGRIALE